MTFQEIKYDTLVATGTAVFLFVAWAFLTMHQHFEAMKASFLP